jgi:hypothetical protein
MVWLAASETAAALAAASAAFLCSLYPNPSEKGLAFPGPGPEGSLLSRTSMPYHVFFFLEEDLEDCGVASLEVRGGTVSRDVLSESLGVF